MDPNQAPAKAPKPQTRPAEPPKLGTGLFGPVFSNLNELSALTADLLKKVNNTQHKENAQITHSTNGVLHGIENLSVEQLVNMFKPAEKRTQCSLDDLELLLHPVLKFAMTPENLKQLAALHQMLELDKRLFGDSEQDSACWREVRLPV